MRLLRLLNKSLFFCTTRCLVLFLTLVIFKIRDSDGPIWGERDLEFDENKVVTNFAVGSFGDDELDLALVSLILRRLAVIQIHLQNIGLLSVLCVPELHDLCKG